MSRESPRVVFLMETKSNKGRMEFIRRKLGMKGCFTVECVGKSGGLCLLWDESMNLKINFLHKASYRLDDYAWGRGLVSHGCVWLAE